MVKVIDDVLPKTLFDELSSFVLSGEFPWHFGRKVFDDDNTPAMLVGWCHTVFYRGKWSQRGDLFSNSAMVGLGRANEKPTGLGRMRLILNTATDKSYATAPHVDFSEEHMTALLYLNDADGVTRIFKQKYDPTLGLNDIEYFKQHVEGREKVLKEIEPKANRMVVFDGRHYHNGSTPVAAVRRVVLNINYSTAPIPAPTIQN